MAAHTHHDHPPADDIVRPGPGFGRASLIFLVVGLIGIVAALLVALPGGGLRRFYFAYLVGFSFALSIVCGSLFFILIQHLTRAGWSVNVRRLAEGIAMGGFPILAVLSLPILLSTLQGGGTLYRWAWWVDGPETHHAEHADAGSDTHAQSETHGAEHAAASAGAHAAPGHATQVAGDPIDDDKPELHPSHAGVPKPDELTWYKRPWLNPIFFCIRIPIYFAVWIFLTRLFWKESTQQDKTGDVGHTLRMQWWSGVGLVMFALSTTFAAFDLVMSLDPHWYSTMFGVCFFISGLVCFYAVMLILTDTLRRAGYLRGSLTVEHQHDLGKLMFAFTFFWGYVNFSQYMLLWYASLPETVMWLTYRGATTRTVDLHYYMPWTITACVVAFGCFLLPFPGLLSRHVKRNRGGVLFWAGWLLLSHAAYFFWMIGPEFNGSFLVPIPELLSVIGIAGVVAFGVARVLAMHDLRPVHDPRVDESMAFQNM